MPKARPPPPLPEGRDLLVADELPDGEALASRERPVVKLSDSRGSRRASSNATPVGRERTTVALATQRAISSQFRKSFGIRLAS